MSVRVAGWVLATWITSTALVLADTSLDIGVGETDYTASARPVVVDETGSEIPGTESSNGKAFAISFSADQLVRRLHVQLSDKDGQPLPRTKVTLTQPFFEEGAARIVIARSGSYSSGSDLVREIWETNVEHISEDNLLEFAFRTHDVALARIFALPKGRPPHTYDVWAVFRYIETVARLANGRHLVPDSDAIRARDWLLDMADSYPEVAKVKGLTLARIQGAIKSLDDSEGELFVDLWNNVNALASCDEQLPKLKAYKQLLIAVPAGERRDRVLKITGVRMLQVEGAISACTARIAEAAHEGGSAEDRSFALEQLKLQVDALDVYRADNKLPPNLDATVLNDRQYLQQLQSIL